MYNKPSLNSLEYKKDHSPLTLADKKAHNIIFNYLSENTEIPIISEEGKQVDFAIRSKWKKFWLVDSLDGTKEFIKKNGEFTVNIALIDNRKSVLGVIYAPTSQTLYYGTKATGALKKSEKPPNSKSLLDSRPYRC